MMLLLGREPFLYTRSPVKNCTTDKRPRRPNAKHIPAVERARIPLQFSGELFLR
jgi:hypothetical protein